MKLNSLRFSVISIFILLVLISIVGNYRESSATVRYELTEPYLTQRTNKINNCIENLSNEKKDYSFEIIENSCTSVYKHIFKSYEIQVWK